MRLICIYVSCKTLSRVVLIIYEVTETLFREIYKILDLSLQVGSEENSQSIPEEINLIQQILCSVEKIHAKIELK